MDKFSTDKEVEKMVSGLVADTRTLLNNHREFLLTLARQLHEQGSQDAKDVAPIALEYGLTAEIREEGYLHLPAYRDKIG